MLYNKLVGLKVSIIIPIYNVSDFIESCLSSALDQTYKDIEFVLVDDCSPDDSIDKANYLLKKHIRKDAVKVVIHEKNKGLSGARNTGIVHSTGDYLYFLDSDDKIPVNAIEELVKACNKKSPDFVIGGFEPFGASLYEFPVLKLPKAYIEGNDKIFDLFLKEQWYPMAWNKLVNKEFLLSNKLFFYEGIYHEDILWSYQLALVADSMASNPVCTYDYRLRENSIMGSKSLKHYEDMLICARGMGDLGGIEKNAYARTYLETFLIMIVYDMFQNNQSKHDILSKIEQIKNEFKIRLSFPVTKRDILNLLKFPAFILPKNLSYGYISMLSKIISFLKRN